MDDKFRLTYHLTYYTMGSKKDVDTSRFRRAIWNYIQCMFGIRHDDYDYGEVNQLLERSLKTYIKSVVCFPERVTRKDYDSILKEFRHSEKIHVNLMLVEARIQAELLYALRAIMHVVVASVVELLTKYAPDMREVYRRSDSGSVFVIFELAGNSAASLRVTADGLVLVNIDLSPEDNIVLNHDDGREIEALLCDKLSITESKCICPIRRGGLMDRHRYLTSSDERILEYDVSEVVADVKSEFQHIQIFRTVPFGNLLVLDGLQNLAESDLIYTETLMQRGKIDYTGKRILVLGAGDGALLWELLKENPGMVTMVEIDEIVIKLCRQHLRTACGTALDSLSGPHHQIIIGNCLVELDSFAERGDKFDFVFADLTDIPLSIEPQNKEWQFLQQVLEKSLSLLEVDGTFLTHGSGISSVNSLNEFENYLRALELPVEFDRCQTYVPSFMEDWVFYQIRRASKE
nr:EOG090X07PL [Leptodora kindtii]